MTIPIRIIAAAVAAALCCQTAGAKTLTEATQERADVGRTFYGGSAEGWYWYQDPEDPLPDEEPLEPPAAPVQTAQAQPEQKRPTGPQALSAAWVRMMMPKYQDAMWNNPTPDNVQAYMLLQRFAIDRSQKVARVAQEVVLGNPLLDENFRRPLATAGVHITDSIAAKRYEDTLRKISKRAGFYFFFSSSCKFCQLMGPLLKSAHDQYGFEVLAVTMDGKELPTAKFDHTVVDAGQAAYLNVKVSPTLFLVSPEDNSVEMIAAGFASLQDILNRILVAAHKNKWLTDVEFDATKPIINPDQQHDLSKELPTMLKAATENPSVLFGGSDADFKPEAIAEKSKKGQALMDDSGYIEPSKFVALFDNTKRAPLPAELLLQAMGPIPGTPAALLQPPAAKTTTSAAVQPVVPQGTPTEAK